MCNNLLQYAHVYAWGREHGRKVISMRFSYKYQYFKICHTSLTGFGWYLLAKYLAALKLLPTASFKYSDSDRDKLEQKMLCHRHIVVSGWYARWYDLFLKYRAEICDLFQIDSQFTELVKVKMQEAEKLPMLTPHLPILRLGVHIRRGDYAQWANGIYYYEDAVYAAYINRFAELHPDKMVHVYLSSNDPQVNEETFQVLCPRVKVHCLAGIAPEDLYMLSECDYVIGPPSTFSLVAAMYRDIPLYRMDTADAMAMTLEEFRLFDFWFQHII
jgi:hypothetical protein